MKDTITLQQKVKVLNKLFDAKCRTEKDLQGLSMESILKIPNITIQDMTVIMELQKATKAGNEVTQLTEPTEQEIRQMREKIEEAQKEKSRAYHRQYSREYRARNLEKRREYDRMKAREYRAKKKAQEAAAAPAQ